MRTGEDFSPIEITEIFFDVYDIEGLLYYKNPHWKSHKNNKLLKFIVDNISWVFNVKYKEQQKEEILLEDC